MSKRPKGDSPPADRPAPSPWLPHGMPVEWLELPDDELGKHLLAMWFVHLAETRGIQPHEIRQDMAEQMVLAARQVDVDDPLLIPLEKAIRLAAVGESARAGQLLRAHVHNGAIRLAALDEATTGQRRQRERAKQPRADALSKYIERFAAEHPGASGPDLIAHLRRAVGDGFIEEVDDDEESGAVYFAVGDHSYSAKLTGLKDRLSRARKKRNSR